jgi:hypothetical protein
MANAKTVLHHSDAMESRTDKTMSTLMLTTVRCRNGSPRRACCFRSHMASQIHAAGTSWISVRRQLVMRSLMPRTRSTRVPAAQATGARIARRSPNARAVVSIVPGSASAIAFVQRTRSA